MVGHDSSNRVFCYCRLWICRCPPSGESPRTLARINEFVIDDDERLTMLRPVNETAHLAAIRRSTAASYSTVMISNVDITCATTAFCWLDRTGWCLSTSLRSQSRADPK